jgi:tRNA1(Val) A37 N6-methylase TrmN6
MIRQPTDGYRAGLDAVMLAAAVPARIGDSICDVGAGVGTAALCVAARVRGLNVTAVEIDETLAALARANAERNPVAGSFAVVVADVWQKPRTLPRQHFHHVLTNPPFHDIARGTRAPASAKARATSAHAHDLVAWLRFARALVRPQGTLTAILPPDQIPRALAALAPDGQGTDLLPLWPKPGAPAKRVIIRTRMNSRSPLALHPGLVLHGADGKPTPQAEAVLRRAEALSK